MLTRGLALVHDIGTAAACIALAVTLVAGYLIHVVEEFIREHPIR